MITKISLKNITSYGEIPGILQTDKRINLVYWLNGTWKTTISNYLQDRNNPIFSDCSLDWLWNEKVLVYNQKFIDENFYESTTQKWIFTLSSENREAEEKIEKANEEIEKLKLLIKNEANWTWLYYDLEKTKNDLEQIKNTAQEKLWEIKNTYSWWDRVLEFCLEGKKGSKESLFQYINSINKPTQQPATTIEQLKQDAATITGDSVVYDETLIETIGEDFENLWNQDILQEVIVWKEDSIISDLIKKLNHSSWVKQWLSYTQKPTTENEVCPFCQQSTINNELYQSIEEYFDITYQKNIQEIQNLLDIYNTKYNELTTYKEELLKIDFIKENETEFNLLYDLLLSKIERNISLIKIKQADPSQKILLETLWTTQTDLNDFLGEIKSKIIEHNEKVQNKAKTKQKIIKDFWELMRWEYDQTIVSHLTQKTRYESEKVWIEIKITEINGLQQVQREIVVDAQKDVINIDEAIDNINTELKLFWTEWFSIVKTDDWAWYKIYRENTTNWDLFKSLSEWEKTVISFLYFIELCKWKETEDETIDEKIAIIDDPISSLSHMYVFNIAQLIRKNFFQDVAYKQVFVLTHNLYFFHELLHKIKNSDFSLFRTLKNTVSHISILDRKDIQNEYQSYRQIIKDHDENKATEVALANSMRNILERFFWFIDKYNFNELTQELEKDEKNNFFIRYINKESHSDAINISDTKEIDPILFKSAFKQIFIDAGFEDHYNKMMS